MGKHDLTNEAKDDYLPLIPLMTYQEVGDGLPTGSPLATSASVPFSSLPALSPDSFVSFTFSSFNLSASTTYAFLVGVGVPNSGTSVVSFNVIRYIEDQGYVSRSSLNHFFKDDVFDWARYKIVGTADGLIVRKRLIIEGLGFGSELDGVVAFEAGSENSIVRGVRFNSKLTLNANKLHISDCWQSSGNEIDNNGIDNNIRIIQEV